MNKGVELLLARRETNPEEFYPQKFNLPNRYGRWDVLLINHGVNLDNPNAKVHKPRIFAREVMNRLLTGYDLEPRRVTRAELLKELLPGLEALFGMEYAKTHRNDDGR